jgi:hypothetical protein
MAKNSTSHRRKAQSSGGRSRYEKGYNIYTMEGKDPLRFKKPKKDIKKPKAFSPPTLGDICPQS